MVKDKGNKSFWERVAKIYAPFMKSSEGLYRKIDSYMSRYLTKEMYVLELACGTGQLSFRMSKGVKYWDATDFSDKMISGANKNPRSANLHFSVQDASGLPYADACFDAVVISNALHIMPDPVKAMGEIYRVLKPGGFLFAPTFIHGEGTGFLLRVRLMELIGFKTYHKWNGEAFTCFVKEQGFDVIEAPIIGSKLAPLCCLTAQKKERAFRGASETAYNGGVTQNGKNERISRNVL